MFLKRLLNQIPWNVSWLKSSPGPPICNTCDPSLMSLYLLKWNVQIWAPASMEDWQLKVRDTTIIPHPHPMSSLVQLRQVHVWKQTESSCLAAQLMTTPHLAHTNACHIRFLGPALYLHPDFTFITCKFHLVGLGSEFFLWRTFWILTLLSFKVATFSRCVPMENLASMPPILKDPEPSD